MCDTNSTTCPCFCVCDVLRLTPLPLPAVSRCVVFFLVVGAVNEVDIVYSSNAAIYNLLLDQEVPE